MMVGVMTPVGLINTTMRECVYASMTEDMMSAACSDEVVARRVGMLDIKTAARPTETGMVPVKPGPAQTDVAQ